jgi:hypothetical protein
MPFSRQKKQARQNDAKITSKCLTLIRGNVILNELTIEKGFRDGDVRGLFSFAGLISVFRWRCVFEKVGVKPFNIPNKPITESRCVLLCYCQQKPALCFFCNAGQTPVL